MTAAESFRRKFRAARSLNVLREHVGTPESKNYRVTRGTATGPQSNAFLGQKLGISALAGICFVG